MASSGVTVSASGAASEAPEVPDNVGDWLRGVYRFATDRNDFRRCAFQAPGRTLLFESDLVAEEGTDVCE
ncbi:Mitochondrial import receptor subunit TOM6-like [Cricetulus griseus]|uniref:Mitochondrial import receptor subunit TOM6-like n=1 Tax=Cricetulus griseus TaxID=10029 RepID=G3I111_CRIGR|nr:Mitochondrial import receptor subunit TOM6-like [Cricetulus griseus]